MCNQELLISYLYDDLDAADRQAFDAHLAQCAACRGEVAGLRETRRHLGSWTPPEPQIDFHVVQSSRTAPAPPRRLPVVPRWGLAAAASLLLAAGAAGLANLEVRYGADGLVVRTGWADAPAPQAAQAFAPGSTAGPQAAATDATAAAADATATAPLRPASTEPASSEQSEQLLAMVKQLARRVQELEAQGARVARAEAAPAGITATELRKILAESESRQRVEMALRIEQVWKDFNAARADDFVRVQQTVGPELQRQQRMLQNVMYQTRQK